MTPFKTPSLKRRMACWIYEGMLLFGIVFVAGFVFTTATKTQHAMENRHALQAFVFSMVGIYFVWFWLKGQTLAMKTWHIRLVSNGNHRLSLKGAFIRYVLSWIWFLPPLAAAALLNLNAILTSVAVLIWASFWVFISRWAPEHQFWHDVWAHTRLIQDPTNPG